MSDVLSDWIREAGAQKQRCKQLRDAIVSVIEVIDAALDEDDAQRLFDAIESLRDAVALEPDRVEGKPCTRGD